VSQLPGCDVAGLIADVESVTRQLEGLYSEGFRSVAVCLLHSFTFQKHELQVEEVAKRIGFTQVSVSSQLQPMSAPMHVL
jgi:5-oxoprolinase (ATP-hydrolysing)